MECERNFKSAEKQQKQKQILTLKNSSKVPKGISLLKEALSHSIVKIK